MERLSWRLRLKNLSERKVLENEILIVRTSGSARKHLSCLVDTMG